MPMRFGSTSVAGEQVVDRARRPGFRIVAADESVEAQCRARSRLVDHQRRDAARGEGGRVAGAEDLLLHRIEPVAGDQHRSGAAVARCGLDEQRGERRALVGNVDELDAEPLQLDAPAEHGEALPVGLPARRVVAALHALGRQKIARGALVLDAGRQLAALRLVGLAVGDDLVGDPRPRSKNSAVPASSPRAAASRIGRQASSISPILPPHIRARLVDRFQT